MPDHSGHELLLSAALVGIVWCVTGVSVAFIFTCAVAFGTVLLSPDLDVKGSAPHRRWWFLKWIWYLYQKMVWHRSPWTHWPLLGTAGRLLYLGCVPCVVLIALEMRGHHHIASIRYLYQTNEYEVWAALAGIEASAWLHVSADWVWR